MKILVLGPQGSGKSTQAKMLAEYLNLPEVEMGQLFRDRFEKNDPDSLVIKQTLERGDLVSNDLTLKTLNRRLIEDDCQNGYILEGYPRNMDQMQSLPENINKVIYIDVPEKEAIARLKKRGRHDDDPQTITKRLENYHKQTEPVLKYFKDKGILFQVDGRPSIEEVHQTIVKIIENESNKN